MTTSRLILLGVFEIIALLVIARIWVKRRHRRLIVRLIWSAVLLVPGFGVLAYFFLSENTDEHSFDDHPTASNAITEASDGSANR